MAFDSTIMSIVFILLIFIFSTTHGSPISHHTKIQVKCGNRPVAYATIHFHEFKDDHHGSVFPDFQRDTDKFGHYHFHQNVDLREFVGKDIRVMVKDNCGMEHEKDVKCNLPYNQFEVPLKLLPHDDFESSLILDLTTIQQDYRLVKCV